MKVIVGHLGVLRLIYQFLGDPEARYLQGTLNLENKDPWGRNVVTEGGEKDLASES